MTDSNIPEYVRCILYNRNGEILLVFTEKLGIYTFPGGKINPGEDAENAVRREVKEETNLDIENLKLLYQQTSYFEHFQQYWKGHVFIGDADFDKIKLNEPDKISSVKIIHISDFRNIPEQKSCPNIRFYIKEYLDK